MGDPELRSDPGREESQEPQESPKERLDRELIELLNEVRVALPGSQVLFAFLLVLPFQEAFHQLGEVQKDIYAGALLSSAAAIALLIAPSSYHRINFRQPMKEDMIRWANGLLIAGMGCIVLGITLSVALVLDVALGSPLSVLLSLLTGAWFVWFWFGVPVLRRRRFEQPSGPPD
jgi:Family of unknown function (DUF6328)